jgi:hypothetical protein
MKFVQAEPNQNYEVARYVSEGGGWELGLIPRTFGRFAIGFSPINAIGPTVTYCLGDDHTFIQNAVATIMLALMAYPETVSERQLALEFPAWNVRPIDRDVQCWTCLQEMAATQLEKLECQKS